MANDSAAENCQLFDNHALPPEQWSFTRWPVPIGITVRPELVASALTVDKLGGINEKIKSPFPTAECITWVFPRSHWAWNLWNGVDLRGRVVSYNSAGG
jgi:hypothetical protein